MSIHSLVILSDKHHYVNIVNSAIRYLQKILSPSSFKLWIALREATSFTDGIFTGSHRLLAHITNLSISTVIRACKTLISLGLVGRHSNKGDDGRILENTYILETPEHLLMVVKSSPLRAKPETELEPDYSVVHEEITDGIVLDGPLIIDIKADDTSEMVGEKTRKAIKAHRGFDNAPLPGGQLGKILQRMKKKLSTIGGGMCQIDTPLITILDPENNTTPETEPQTAIPALRPQEEPRSLPNGENGIHSNDQCIQKTIPQSVINRIKKIVNAVPGVSNPSELVQEAIHFVANRKEEYGEWQSVGSFKRILSNNGWTTPFSMRKK
jgi:hypothetical protein